MAAIRIHSNRKQIKQTSLALKSLDKSQAQNSRLFAATDGTPFCICIVDYFTVLAISSRFSLTANLLKLFLLVIKLLIIFYIYGGSFGFSTHRMQHFLKPQPVTILTHYKQNVHWPMVIHSHRSQYQDIHIFKMCYHSLTYNPHFFLNLQKLSICLMDNGRPISVVHNLFRPRATKRFLNPFGGQISVTIYN